MPLAFPSHQGLVAPLWRRWPATFRALPVCCGALAPDVVDGAIGAWRGYLGQGYGHSLFGLFVFCLPVGMLLTWATAAAGTRLRARGGWLERARQSSASWSESPRALDSQRRGWVLLVSVLAGALSHAFFDFVSHGNFLWLYPWYKDPTFFPTWWYTEWLSIPLPGYRQPYPAGPHLLVWIALSGLGAWMFLRKPSRG